MLTSQGPDALVELVQGWLEEVAHLMALLGVHDVAGLRHTDLLLTGAVREHAELRGVDVTGYARRSPFSQV